MHALGHAHRGDVGPARQGVPIHRPVIIDQPERKGAVRIKGRQRHQSRLDPLGSDRFDGAAMRRNLIFPQIEDVDPASPL
jgi:hypothetical protein